jgi:hypothetical protein
MKVYIGPYSHWFAPYRWAKQFLRWRYGLSVKGRMNISNIDAYDKVNSIARKKFKWLRTIEEWFDARYKRKVKVRVDYYDTWGMDHTLGLIILPMLKQLKDTKYGSPYVDDGDVPEELKSTNAEPLTEVQISTGETDNNFHQRWDWVLNEMIWAFEQLVDDDADSQFYTDADPALPRSAPDISFDEGMRRGKFDKDGYTAWQNRKTHGLTLFGRYFEGLWD